jgi:hypothetical protein
MPEPTHAWLDTTLSPRERATALVGAMTLEQRIAQLHGAMETIDIYALSRQAAEGGADIDQLAAQIRVERHVTGIDELGIPRFRITSGPVGVGMGYGTPSPPATATLGQDYGAVGFVIKSGNCSVYPCTCANRPTINRTPRPLWFGRTNTATWTAGPHAHPERPGRRPPDRYQHTPSAPISPQHRKEPRS